jgi:hypothetical protein
MTKELAEFVGALKFGFISESQAKELCRLDRLCQVLVRCQCVRFVCAVQDLSTMIARMRAAGDEVRDVSVTSGVPEEARAYKALSASERFCRMHGKQYCSACWFDGAPFNESDCGGAFDGNQVISDADPGL